MAFIEFPTSFRPQFSGHETFPLRQLWLLKYVQIVKDIQEGKDKPTDEEAICLLGVGKNMLEAMRYWAKAVGVVEQTEKGVVLSDLGELIFRTEGGLDKYCEHAATPWLVHWQLSSTPEKFTTNWFLFNCINVPAIDKETLLKNLKEWSDESGFKASEQTIKRSIEVVLRSYVPRHSGRGHLEDFIEPLLGELDLLQVRSRDVIEFHRSEHPTLPDGLFAYALIDYWSRLQNKSSTLDFNHILHDYGSPGRVFKLDSKSLETRLSHLDELTGEALTWTEQAGLRQVICKKNVMSQLKEFKHEMLKKAYAS